MASAQLQSIVQAAPSELSWEAQSSVPLILKTALAQGITDRTQLAYILATAEHESKLGRFMREGWDPDTVPAQRDYDAPGDPKGLGNHPNPDPNENYTNGDGYRYRGRGFVQVTGRNHYQSWSKKLGVDLVADPAKTEDPAIAAQILVRGMQEGSFTSRKLSDYLQEGNADFHSARRIINGLDRADEIAAIAQVYQSALQRVNIQALQTELNAKPSLASQLGGTADSHTQPAPPLKLGDRHPSVKTLQLSLNQLGYPLEASGIYSPETEMAVKNLQHQQHLTIDGVVGPQTWKAIDTLQHQVQQSGRALGNLASSDHGSALGSALPAIPQAGKSLGAAAQTGSNLGTSVQTKLMVQRGDRGKTVAEVQTTLNKLGYGLEVDGIFGTKTEQAVRSFQTKQKLAPDAIVGPKTWKALQQVQQSAIAPEFSRSTHTTNTPTKPIKLEPLRQPPGNTYHGAPRPGRQHAGVDTYNPNASTKTEAPQATLGGIIVNIGHQPGGYGHYIDIHNPQLGVVERIAEYSQPHFTEADLGKVIAAGTVVGTGADQTTIIHREIRPYDIYKQSETAKYGFDGTVDWAKYVTEVGLYRQEGNDFTPTGRTIPQQYGAAPEAAQLGTSLAETGKLNDLAFRSQPSAELRGTATAAAALQSSLVSFPGSEQFSLASKTPLTPVGSLADLTNQLSSSITPTREPDTHQVAPDFELG